MKQEPTGAGRRPAGGIPALQGREDVNLAQYIALATALVDSAAA